MCSLLSVAFFAQRNKMSLLCSFFPGFSWVRCKPSSAAWTLSELTGETFSVEQTGS